ncbi:MAG: DUF4302 domain-containing protein [Bacteroidales bacterium]|nr:DUF4302 domain-containing protein [Bacteroidales bacterium]MCM1146293.1 DUF4302 domain-containing protein [Bacteroidales bacterium]MCM1205269.1 DUF4302 domain-containing protein [Bacillota bacterium]MCM1509644.1 DUF4302 domain-containing protein [Clostridium sp.]
MKKNLYSIISLLLGVFFLAACSPEVDEKFNESASDRIKGEIAKTKQILESAENGWRMEYYGSTTYGGYNVFMQFKDDKVTVASEKVGASHNAGIGADGKAVTASSHYKVEQSQGVLLSFDEHNEVFHYFSEPNNADYGEPADGMGGDLEFRVISATPEKIELTGKKHEARIVMYPMPAGQTVEEYITEVTRIKNLMDSRSYKLEIEGSTRDISAVTSYRRLRFAYYDDNNDYTEVAAPFVITTEGYKFYKPVTVDGNEISAIKAGTSDDYFETESTINAKLWTYVPTKKELLETGMWFVNYADLGTFAQPYWNTMLDKLATTGPNNTRERMVWALIGIFQKKWGIHLQTARDYAYYGLTLGEVSGSDGNEITLKCNTLSNNKSGKDFYNKLGLKDALFPFVGRTTSSTRTFVVTSDDERHPTYILLTDKNEPTNVIKLWAEQVLYPYGDLDDPDKE